MSVMRLASRYVRLIPGFERTFLHFRGISIQRRF